MAGREDRGVVGPRGASPEDARLAALRAHRRALDEAPQTEGRDALAEKLLGVVLALAQTGDLLATDVGIDTPTRRPTPDEIAAAGYDPAHPGDFVLTPFRERNPLPGMQSSAGRLAWAAAEHAALAKLRARKPKLGTPATLAAVLAHLALVKDWDSKIDRFRRR